MKCKHYTERKRISGLLSFNEFTPQQELNLKVLAVITNGSNKMLSFNCWRSVDVLNGELTLVKFDDRSQHLRFDGPPTANLHVGYINIALEVRNNFCFFHRHLLGSYNFEA